MQSTSPRRARMILLKALITPLIRIKRFPSAKTPGSQKQKQNIEQQ